MSEELSQFEPDASLQEDAANRSPYHTAPELPPGESWHVQGERQLGDLEAPLATFAEEGVRAAARCASKALPKPARRHRPGRGRC